MNYGRRKASKRQKEITSKGTMQGKRMGVRLFKAFLLLILVACVSVGVGGLIFVKKIINDSPDISPDDVRPSGYTTFVYADDGTTELERFVASSRLMRYQLICNMHLSQLRTNVSMIIRELTHRVSCVPSL